MHSSNTVPLIIPSNQPIIHKANAAGSEYFIVTKPKPLNQSPPKLSSAKPNRTFGLGHFESNGISISPLSWAFWQQEPPF